MRILIVEDNADITASIADYLEFKGHQCDYAYDGMSGLNLATSHEYDLYIFDIAMPNMDGLELCQVLRGHRKDKTPVIFLTARDTLEDKLAGFASGADDYLVKPFELKELYARLEAISRRLSTHSSTLNLSDLTVNIDTQEVHRQGEKIQLSPNNFKLLRVLMEHYPAAVSRKTLEYQLWGDELPDSDSLRSHIYKLRQKIDKPFGQPLIQTVPGWGFRMAQQEGDDETGQ
ncbi:MULTISPECIES: response regulator transcription factor [unclassified Endozoicomonas]|uniref:response regulator transcription factor n=1 Tax=unclassified Endozoicomonas TaxID=2644528 RepID=UPI003BB4903A